MHCINYLDVLYVSLQILTQINNQLVRIGELTTEDSSEPFYIFLFEWKHSRHTCSDTSVHLPAVLAKDLIITLQ